MTCPKCEAPSRVLETRRVVINSWFVVYRDRVCRKNKRHRFTTRETVS